jgi:hypothetical protein
VRAAPARVAWGTSPSGCRVSARAIKGGPLPDEVEYRSGMRRMPLCVRRRGPAPAGARHQCHAGMATTTDNPSGFQ